MANSANEVPAAVHGLPPSLGRIDTELFARERVERAFLVLHDLRGRALRFGFRYALRLQDQRELVLFGFGRLLDLLALSVQLHRRELARVGDGEPLAECHRAGAGHEPGNASQQDRASRRAGAGHTHHQTEVRDEPIVRAEHGRAQVVARGVSMPGLGATDVASQAARAMRRPGDRFYDRGVTALFGGDRRRVGLTQIFAAIVELRRGDSRQHEARAEAAREYADDARAQRGRERHIGDSGSSELVAPEAGVARFGCGELQEDVAPIRVDLGGSERVVERRAVQLVDEVGAKSGDVIHSLHGVVSRL
jgi:hypothetical protein